MNRKAIYQDITEDARKKLEDGITTLDLIRKTLELRLKELPLDVALVEACAKDELFGNLDGLKNQLGDIEGDINQTLLDLNKFQDDIKKALEKGKVTSSWIKRYNSKARRFKRIGIDKRILKT